MDLNLINKYKNQKYISSFFDDEYNNDHETLLDPDNKYLLIYRHTLSFLIKNNHVSIMLQNFLQSNLYIPIFQNSIIFENNSNDSNESFKLLLSRLPFQYIVADYDNFYDFILEKSLDIHEELSSLKTCGFYLNVSIDKEKVALTFYDYITPFYIDNDEVYILKKNDILKYSIFYISEKCSKTINFRMIFLSSKKIPSDNLIESLKSKLQLPESNQEISEYFINNNILIKNQNREQMFTSYITTLNIDDENSIVKLNYDLCFTIDINKQKMYHISVIKKNLKTLKYLVNETIIEFNENKQSYKYTLENDKILMESIKIYKPYNNEYNYYKINNKYKYLFYFICKCNNIDFGSDLLILKKYTILDNKRCFEEIKIFKETLIEIINNFFDKEFKDIYIKKQI